MNRLFTLYFFLLAMLATAEGTKELKPAATSKGNLLLMKNYSDFGLYGAGPREQMKVRIASGSEKLYFGFNNKNGLDRNRYNNDKGPFVPGIPFRIVSPSGQIVFTSVIPDSLEKGNVANWTQAVAGPKQLGNSAGYDAFEYQPVETGDYVIEFDPSAKDVNRLNIDFFDVTVADAMRKPVKGRLHSASWQISTTENYNNSFEGKVYPYDGSSAVYEVDFNGIQPLVFTINFNSKGTGRTDDYLLARTSKIGNKTYPEYEVFLNPPDPALYPAVQKILNLEGTVVKKDCISSDFCLDFKTNTDGHLQGFIDVNQNDIYDSLAGDVYFEKSITQPGTVCIPWNGKDAKGRLVTGQFNIYSTLHFGMTNLPLYDVESNTKGYKVKVVRPAGIDPPLLFWDDSQITGGTAIDPKVNLTGCNSAATGCHRWKNRGSIMDASKLEEQETINTWWYSSIKTHVIKNANPYAQQVQLSFHPDKLIDKDTTVCKGDSLRFFIFNDGKNHFSTTNYFYDWSFNQVAAIPNIREQLRTVTTPLQVVVKATDKSALNCISFDTLRVHVVEPVKLKATVTEPPCNNTSGSIDVVVTAGPPNKKIFWKEFPSNNSASLVNIPKGTYHLKVEDTAYPHCGADTVLKIQELNGIEIDTVITTGTSCTENKGTAEVKMTNPAGNYEYSWDGAAYGNSVRQTDMQGGTHHVTVRDKVTGCQDKSPFSIPERELVSKVTSGNEICSNGKGMISVSLPDNNFNIFYNGTSGPALQENLSEGSYQVKVVSTLYSSCIFDTLIRIRDSSVAPVIKSLVLTASDCQNPTGSAVLQMEPGNYLMSLNGGVFASRTRWDNLTTGYYTISIRDGVTGCLTDTVFELQAKNVPFSFVFRPELCNSLNGKIEVFTSSPAQKVSWEDIAGHQPTRKGLRNGTYTFTVTDTLFPACKTKRQVVIKDSSYGVQADFNYEIISAGSSGSKSIYFTNQSRHYIWSHWLFGDGVSSSEKNPVHEYKTDGEYTVSLYVTDSLGCYGMAQKKISTRELVEHLCGIALPNAFSPNGDFQNDDIGILGWAPSVELKIFNRWGEVIFRTFELEERWDGKYRHEESPVGVYPFILDWQCPDGKGGTVRNQKVGDITLVR